MKLKYTFRLFQMYPLPLTGLVWIGSHKQEKKKLSHPWWQCGEKCSIEQQVGKLILCPQFSNFNKYFSGKTSLF